MRLKTFSMQAPSNLIKIMDAEMEEVVMAMKVEVVDDAVDLRRVDLKCVRKQQKTLTKI